MTEILTVRVPDELADAIDTEYTEYGYSSKAEYVREILRNRSASDSNTELSGASDPNTTPETGANTDEIRDRLDDLERQVEALQATIEDLERGTSQKTTADGRGETVASVGAHPDRRDTPVADTNRESEPSDAPGDDVTTEGVTDDSLDSTDLPPLEDDVKDRIASFVDGINWSAAKNDFPDDQDERAAAALLACYEYLREKGTASKGEFVGQIMPDHPAGYELHDGDGRYRGGWWRTLVAPGLETLPGVEKPAGGGQWKYDDGT